VFLPVELQHLAEMALQIDLALSRMGGSGTPYTPLRRFNPAEDTITTTAFLFVKRTALRVPVATAARGDAPPPIDRMSKAQLLRCAIDVADAMALPARLPDAAVHFVANALARGGGGKADEKRLAEIVLSNVCWSPREDSQLLRWASAVAKSVHTDLQHLDPQVRASVAFL
jgi:hypothetical protein